MRAVAAMALLALTAGTALAAQAVINRSFANELGDGAQPGGPLHYVALGDSFTSGEGDPYVPPGTALGVNRSPLCVLPSLEKLWGHCAQTTSEDVENDVGWLGDTGTDIGRLPFAERRVADFTDSYSYGGNNCHRSAHAYPARVWGALDAEDSDWGVTFPACSGALVEHYSGEFRDEPPQREAFNNGPADLVTLGFGGNDVMFGFVVSCALGEAGVDRGRILSPGTTKGDPCRNIISLRLPDKLDALRASLSTIYTDIKNPSNGFLAENARVIAIGYPRLFPDDPPDSCGLGANSSIGRDSMVWLNGFTDRLNTIIEQEARSHGIDFVNTADVISQPGRDRVRHDFCIDDGSDRWVNRFVYSDMRRSMHPKYQYHERVAELVVGCWRDRKTCSPQAAETGRETLTLGKAWNKFTLGFGQARPSNLDFGRHATTRVEDIAWSSWGAPTAVGFGNAPYAPPGDPFAEAELEPATVMAFDLGDCQGRPMYRKVAWIFPQRGESFASTSAYDVCEGY